MMTSLVSERKIAQNHLQLDLIDADGGTGGIKRERSGQAVDLRGKMMRSGGEPAPSQSDLFKSRDTHGGMHVGQRFIRRALRDRRN